MPLTFLNNIVVVVGVSVAAVAAAAAAAAAAVKIRSQCVPSLSANTLSTFIRELFIAVVVVVIVVIVVCLSVIHFQCQGCNCVHL